MIGDGAVELKTAAWYTNPQTEAFCGMLGVTNVINPAPVVPS